MNEKIVTGRTFLRTKTNPLLIFILILLTSVVPVARTLHPMSIGLNLNVARMLPWDESNDLGYGATFSYQFAFNSNYSLLAAFSYNYIGKDTYFSRYSDSIPLTIELRDFAFQIGAKRYFLADPTRPFISLTLDSHILHKKYTYSKNVDPDLEPGLSLAVGLEKQFRPRYFFNAELCLHGFQYYSYPVFRLGIRYHFKNSL